MFQAMIRRVTGCWASDNGNSQKLSPPSKAQKNNRGRAMIWRRGQGRIAGKEDEVDIRLCYRKHQFSWHGLRQFTPFVLDACDIALDPVLITDRQISKLQANAPLSMAATTFQFEHVANCCRQ